MPLERHGVRSLLKKITITVRWQNPNAPLHQARLVTLAGDY
jgi:hypothetical protein